MALIEMTAEQQAIIAAAKGTKDNLLINALAGAGKTSTLVMMVKAMPVQPVLCLAFNKKISIEMSERMPGHVDCSTLNSLGHRAWQQRIGRKLTVRANKMGELLKAHIDTLKNGAKQEAYANFAALQRTARAAKVAGVVPPGTPEAEGLVGLSEFMSDADDDLLMEPDKAEDIIALLLTRSIELAFEGVIDYDDQIYQSTLFGASFPNFPLVMIDEAQDLSALNHAMLRKIVRKRLIAVGDPNQSIYGFRGAVADGMAALRADFQMTEFSLSTTFRCPQAIVRRAQNHVPHFKWAEGAAEGKVFDLTDDDAYDPLGEWSPKGIPDGAAIICRNNAPLMSVAMTLLRAGRGVNVVGSDLGPQLIKALKALGPETLEQDDVFTSIDKWEAARIKRKRSSEGATRDRADCLRVFAEFGATLGDALRYAERIFAAEGPIQLLSIHKSKGLEWQTVYHLDPWRVPSRFATEGEALRQELNCRYVCETRARQRLILVNTKDLQA